ncbi:MAG TPA: hypothetical protein VH306_02365 [Gaiellaceae bacterium]
MPPVAGGPGILSPVGTLGPVPPTVVPVSVAPVVSSGSALFDSQPAR